MADMLKKFYLLVNVPGIRYVSSSEADRHFHHEPIRIDQRPSNFVYTEGM